LSKVNHDVAVRLKSYIEKNSELERELIVLSEENSELIRKNRLLKDSENMLQLQLK